MAIFSLLGHYLKKMLGKILLKLEFSCALSLPLGIEKRLHLCDRTVFRDATQLNLLCAVLAKFLI